MAAQTTPPQPLQGENDNHTAWILRRVWDRVNRQNEHFMGVIVGREGSGKSYTAIKIAESLDPTFDSDRIIFDVKTLLEVLRSGEHSPGNFYVLDEAGVSFGRRTWQERSQVLANQALQLIRSHNLGLIFTLPRLSELDSQTEGRLQALVEIVDKVPDEYVDVKWKWVMPDRVDPSGNNLKKYPRRRENGHLKRITRNRFAPPDSSDVIQTYEERKSAFQERIYDETIEALSDDDEEEEERTPKDVATDIANGNVAKVVSEHGNTGEPYINAQLIRAEYGCSHADAKTVKSLLDKQIDLSDIDV